MVPLICTPWGAEHWPGDPRRRRCVVGYQWQFRVDGPHGRWNRHPWARLGRNPYRRGRGCCNAGMGIGQRGGEDRQLGVGRRRQPKEALLLVQKRRDLPWQHGLLIGGPCGLAGWTRSWPGVSSPCGSGCWLRYYYACRPFPVSSPFYQSKIVLALLSRILQLLWHGESLWEKGKNFATGDRVK